MATIDRAPGDWARTWLDPYLDLRLLQARYRRHAYPRHSHDYYVICLIDQGRQSFWYEGRRHFTPPGGLILINPGAVHTGEPAAAEGFAMRCLYPSVALMQIAALNLTGQPIDLPLFAQVRVDDPESYAALSALHTALSHGAGALESESRFTLTLGKLFARYGDHRAHLPALCHEREAVQRARRLIDERYAEGVSLNDLAAHVALSPFHLLRAFRAEIGLPPHAYLDSVRVRQAERLIAAGQPLAEVAAATGFSSQSHLTHHFKRLIGVTPGQYGRPA